MAQSNLKIQQFRANDIVDNGGKQFELGKSWCLDFFQIPVEDINPIINLVFKPLSEKHAHLSDYRIELKLAEVTKREDRKAYSNSETGRSQIKDFFIDKLHLKWPDNSEDYFAIMDTNSTEYNLYYIPQLMYENFISFFKSQDINVTTVAGNHLNITDKNKILQQIFYGAPGTSKSYTINRITRDKEVIRTTFHPDSDYSTFVGAYKPTTDMLPICNELGEPMKIGGTSLHKEQIVYKFVAQSFFQAYINAWKMWLDGTPQYLVIEEINRGNCAQIFGDLFQLLDRNDAGYSDYPITADKDMQKQLNEAFKEIKLPNEKVSEIDSMYNGKSIAGKIFKGELLVLPNNLYIWATMNTSDQSLFPIDSAFKRRWDWTYMPISDAGKGWVIEVDGKHYDWWDFLTKINDKIASTTSSEDKKLGYFFCKADKDKIIKPDRFVGKVLFYLWNDVFKDYEFNNDIFNDEKDSEGQEHKLTFDKFYKSDGHESKVAEEKVELFLKNLDVRIVSAVNKESENTDPDINEVDERGNTDTSRYSINGIGSYGKCRAPFEAIKMFCSENPSLSSSDVVSRWLSLGVKIPNLIETEVQYKERTVDSKDQKLADKSKIHILTDGTTVYVSNQFNPERIQDFVNKVNESDLGIHIEKIRE